MAIVAGAILASQMTYMGELALRSPIEPWYAKPCAPLLIVLVYGVIVLGCMFAEQHIFSGHGEAIPPEIIIFLFMSIGLGLILITILNWVHYEK